MISSSSIFKAHWAWVNDKLTNQKETQDNLKKEISSVANNVKNRVVWGPGIHFWDNIDPNRQMEYRHSYLRQVRLNMPEVVNLQDIKNIVTYLVIGKLPTIFIRLFHSKLMDKFLISLIVYFQVYLEVLDDLKWRRNLSAEQLKHPIAEVREKYCSNWLNKLRCRVGQSYSAMLVGVGELMKFHHMNNKLLKSEMIKDMIIYECLYKFAARTVWIALGRTNFRDIEMEIDHIFRTDKFSIVKRRRALSTTSLVTFQHDELKVVYGEEKVKNKDKLFLNSPAVEELFKLSHDYAFHMGHYTSLEKDILLKESINYLRAIYVIPEELYSKLGITLGILGRPRDDFDILLQFKEKPIVDEVELAILRISTLKEEILPIPIHKLNATLHLFDCKMPIPTRVELEDNEWDFSELINVIRCNQEEESKKYIKLWLKHRFGNIS